ncbi:hypothetical protein [Luteimonas aquatica]|uniref:hypothetical protein n=1 Tax=Luteimonas aquatica TaxID=450364 RepID=UPI001F57F0E7|nr:hypothetical protein [Luteimonas aquatica]
MAQARAKRDEARKLLAAGGDPGTQRKAEKVAGKARAANSFAVIATELMAKRAGKLAAGTAIRERRLLEKDLGPYIGSVPIAESGHGEYVFPGVRGKDQKAPDFVKA